MMEGMRTLEYRPEDREAELRNDAELGRKARIGADVLREYLDKRRNDIVLLLENDFYFFAKDIEVLRDALAELRVMKSFREHCEYLKQQGEIAEEELRNGE